MKAELKEIAGYYPYGLMFEHTDIEDDVTIITEWMSVCSGAYCVLGFKDGCDYTHNADWGEGFDPIITPILRPMSDLTKKIRHRGYNNGEPFVPLVELASSWDYQEGWNYRLDKGVIMTPSYKVYFSEGVLVRCGDDVGFMTSEGDYVDDEEAVTLSFNDVDKLNKWFFDYRGLIEQGKAKSVHDLKSNPYE